MKRIFTKRLCAFLSVCTLFITIFSACSSKNAAISEIGTWEVETVANLDGEIVSNINDADNVSELTCIFKEDSTFLITNGETERRDGTFTKEDAENAISLTLLFSDESTAQGVCGKREYDNGDVADSLIITTDDRIISFLRVQS